LAESDARFEQLITALKRRNFRLTPQRVELVRLIAASKGHPSAGQFHAAVRRRFPTISPATVYKTLALLKEMNQVLEIDLRGDSRYDGRRPEPHPHLVCVRCGKILDADVPLDRESLRRLERESGFRILRPQIALLGLCRDCRAGTGRG
jgi:Fur family peroxide stress response transcriptional regulator